MDEAAILTRRKPVGFDACCGCVDTFHCRYALRRHHAETDQSLPTRLQARQGDAPSDRHSVVPGPVAAEWLVIGVGYQPRD